MNTRETLLQYKAELDAVDVKDGLAFYDLFGRGMNLLSFLDSEISKEFGVSRPTINRWRNGRNAPHPMMRQPVYDFLIKRVSKVLLQTKTSRPSGGLSRFRSTAMPLAAKK